MDRPEISVLIPTFKRAHLLKHALDGLTKQIFKDFEVVIVVKPSGDGTEEIVQQYKKLLNINLLMQRTGFIVDAINLGLKHVRGKIIVFLDDDAIPFPDLLQNYSEIFKHTNVGGVAGDVLPAKLLETGLTQLTGKSEIIPPHVQFSDDIGRKLWNKPIEGLEDYLVYISKSGVVEYNLQVSRLAHKEPVKSLLGMGANMAVLSKAVLGLVLPSSCILGLTYEQFLALSIWKRGYVLVFNPTVKIYHLDHGQTLSRKNISPRKISLKWTEYNLLFFRLYGSERGISIISRVLWLAFSLFFDLKRLLKDGDLKILSKIKGTLLGNLFGVKWLMYRALGLNYNLLGDLKTICEPNSS